MNILYGVAGEGFGHSSRARVMISYLEKKGHNVKVMTYGQGYKALKEDFDVFKVHGLHLKFEKGVLKKRKTLKYNYKNFPKNFGKWKKFYKLMKEFKPDVCISDMEPIVPILSNWFSLPLVSIDNQHRLTNLELKVPKKYSSDFFIAKNIVNTFVSRADLYLILSFAKAKVKKKNSFIVPPILREEVKRIRPRKGKRILVYLTKKDRKILSILKKIEEKFIVFGYDNEKKVKNLEFKIRKDFLKELKNCKAVIATSGFSLMSEAIYLKKPYFALPLKGQFEQVLNSLFLKKARFGDYSEDIKKEEVENFLKNLGKYEKNLEKYKFDFEKVFKLLDRFLKNIEKAYKA